MEAWGHFVNQFQTFWFDCKLGGKKDQFPGHMVVLTYKPH